VHGISEYWLVDPLAQTIEQYWLQNIPSNQYVLVAKWSVGDQINARAVEGFSIPVAAIFDKMAYSGALRKVFNH
jgi:Uma2 family endonuclease